MEVIRAQRVRMGIELGAGRVIWVVWGGPMCARNGELDKK